MRRVGFRPCGRYSRVSCALAILRELSRRCCRLTLAIYKRRRRERPDRPVTGHARSAHHEDDRARADAWLGGRPTNPADLRRIAEGAAGLPLSRAAPPGAPGVDHG